MKVSNEVYQKYKAGFEVDSPHPMCDEEWLFSGEYSTDEKLVFQGYDANLFPLPDFSTWPETEWKQKVIQTGLQRTKDFIGEVWLDSVQIK
jgi:hypothetical protein